MASHVEGRLLRRSIPFVESWVAQLAAKSEAPAAAAATANQQHHHHQQQPPPNKKEQAGKKAAGGAAKKAGTAAASGEKDDNATAMSRCCFAVGRVVEVSRHPESTKLYVERIDLGAELNALSDNAPRTILSGLQEFVKEEDFLNRLVLVIANLEPRKIAGMVSNGMVLCASTGEDPHDASSAGQGARQVVLLNIPEGTAVGERVVFEGHDMPYVPVLKKKLAKNFEEVIAEVKVDDKGVMCWKGIPFRTSAGVITADLHNARVS